MHFLISVVALILARNMAGRLAYIHICVWKKQMQSCRSLTEPWRVYFDNPEIAN